MVQNIGRLLATQTEHFQPGKGLGRIINTLAIAKEEVRLEKKNRPSNMCIRGLKPVMTQKRLSCRTYLKILLETEQRRKEAWMEVAQG